MIFHKMYTIKASLTLYTIIIRIPGPPKYRLLPLNHPVYRGQGHNTLPFGRPVFVAVASISIDLTKGPFSIDTSLTLFDCENVFTRKYRSR